MKPERVQLEASKRIFFRVRISVVNQGQADLNLLCTATLILEAE